MRINPINSLSILTRTSGYLAEVTSHSLQPYRGCGLGKSLCGVGCYVQHNRLLIGNETWGEFVQPKLNATDLYRKQFKTEQSYARRKLGQFSVFMSSSTEPFQPAEQKYRITRSILQEMLINPPDKLILQTHSHLVADEIDLLCQLKSRCDLRVHISIESDHDTLPGLPKPGSTVQKRLAAGRALKDKAVHTVVTIAPLLPIQNPHNFLKNLSDCFDAVVIDHYIEGDGSSDGSRTRRTKLPVIMSQVNPLSVSLEYRDQIVEIARRYFAKVGVGSRGFAGHHL